MERVRSAYLVVVAIVRKDRPPRVLGVAGIRDAIPIAEKVKLVAVPACNLRLIAHCNGEGRAGAHFLIGRATDKRTARLPGPRPRGPFLPGYLQHPQYTAAPIRENESV